MSQIFKKMSEIMADIGPVKKDQKNQAQGFKFRGIDNFVNALHPALVKHGVFMTPRVISERSEIKEVTRGSGKQGFDKHVNLMVEYDFYAEDGSKVTVGPIAAEGLDSGDKATNKALSAALKYALIQTFAVPTEDMVDGDLESPEIGKTEKTTVPEPKTTVSSLVKVTDQEGNSLKTPTLEQHSYKKKLGTSPAPKSNGATAGSNPWDGA